MSKESKSNEYSFRTDSSDYYTDRVAAGADPKTNIILLKEENKLTGDKFLIIMVRKRLVDVAEFRDLVVKYWAYGSGESDRKNDPEQFVNYVVTGNDSEEVDRIERTIEQELRHINNIVTDRVIQVNVKTF